MLRFLIILTITGLALGGSGSQSTRHHKGSADKAPKKGKKNEKPSTLEVCLEPPPRCPLDATPKCFQKRSNRPIGENPSKKNTRWRCVLCISQSGKADCVIVEPLEAYTYVSPYPKEEPAELDNHPKDRNSKPKSDYKQLQVVSSAPYQPTKLFEQPSQFGQGTTTPGQVCVTNDGTALLMVDPVGNALSPAVPIDPRAGMLYPTCTNGAGVDQLMNVNPSQPNPSPPLQLQNWGYQQLIPYDQTNLQPSYYSSSYAPYQYATSVYQPSPYYNPYSYLTQPQSPIQ